MDLAEIREKGLWRELRELDSPQGTRVRWQGRELINFSSNDYLGLANSPELKAAAARAASEFGAGAGASRLICGSLRPHHRLEEALAAFKGTEACLTFSCGYAAALGTIGALVGAGNIIVLDKLVHACIVDAARLCGATLRVFAHNDLENLERILAWARQRPAGGPRSPRILVATESLFSMDGDRAPLREIVELKDRHGAWLLVDEAHATGLYGPRARGLAEEAGVAERVEVQMGTLGKALGAAGGYIAGSRRLIDLLVNRARSFIFSTAPVPAAAAAAEEAVRIAASASGAELRRTLFDRAAQLKAALQLPPGDHPGAIVPLIVGDEARAVALSAGLRAGGFLAPAIRYPTVAKGTARLRFTATAGHTVEDIERLKLAVRAVAEAGPGA
jgi:8-amino-7-oxononanoate synthase